MSLRTSPSPAKGSCQRKLEEHHLFSYLITLFIWKWLLTKYSCFSVKWKKIYRLWGSSRFKESIIGFSFFHFKIYQPKFKPDFPWLNVLFFWLWFRSEFETSYFSTFSIGQIGSPYSICIIGELTQNSFIHWRPTMCRGAGDLQSKWNLCVPSGTWSLPLYHFSHCLILIFIWFCPSLHQTGNLIRIKTGL